MKNKSYSSHRIIFLLFTFIFFGLTAKQKDEKYPGDFPYHILVYHLDLSILAYQLYGQTLAWPFDPYYEEAGKPRNRKKMMEKVREWATIEGAGQVNKSSGLESYRGPGSLGGFPNNAAHDPIIFRYDRIHPWSSTITNALNSWTEYKVPGEITGQIRDVYMCYRKTGKPRDSVAIDKLMPKQNDSDPDARDILLAFEGGTGDKGIENQPASQSLMGFVLVRFYKESKNYDLHIVFRGSRSGSASRAVRQSFRDNKAKGNPDWITDLGYNLMGPETGAGHISQTGGVSRGMSTCMASIYPTLFQCLRQVAKLSPDIVPGRIFVTGHSLGGGLAQVFVSSILLGDQFGPDGSGAAMPVELLEWPWKQLKLITFSAPRVGDAEWAEELTSEGLSSEFFSTPVNPYDRDALETDDPVIVSRLMDNSLSAGFRVLIPTDPITTEKIPGGKHVGKTVYVRKPKLFDPIAPPNFKAHEPARIRQFMSEKLSDPAIPAAPWHTHDLSEFDPSRDNTKKGTPEEYRKLASAIERYYQEKSMYFDSSGFIADFDKFMKICEED